MNLPKYTDIKALEYDLWWYSNKLKQIKRARQYYGSLEPRGKAKRHLDGEYVFYKNILKRLKVLKKIHIFI